MKMKSRTGVWAAWLLSLSLSMPGGLLAQEDPVAVNPRVPTVGRILDRAGKPWAGAKVVFLSRLHPVCADESVDRVEATADARGKYRVDLESDRVYLVWGQGPIGEEKDGWRLTGVECGVMPGQVLKLKESQRRAAVRIQLVDQRTTKGKLRAKLVTHRAGMWRVDHSNLREGMGFGFDLAVDEQGVALLPPLPWKDVWLEIYDAQGLRVQVETLDLSKPLAEGSKQIQVHGVSGLELKGMAANGLPKIQGLVLRQRVRGRLLEVQRTDGDFLQSKLRIAQRLITRSRTELEYPDLELETQGSSRALLLNMLQGNGEIGLGSNRMIMPLRPGRTLRGKMARARRLILQQDPRGRPGAFVGTNAPPPVYEVSSNKDGSLEITGLGPGHYRLLTLLDLEERQALRDGAGVEPQALLAIGSLQQDADLGMLDPARLVRVDLGVSFADGRKGAGVRILVMQPGNAMTQNALILRSQTDRKGRRRLLLPVGGRFDILLASARGHAMVPLDLRQAEPGSVVAKHVGIAAGTVVTGVVRDSVGKPVAGARLRWIVRNGDYRASVLAQRVAPDLSGMHCDEHGRFAFRAPLEKGLVLLFAHYPDNDVYKLEQLQIAGESIENLKISLPAR